MVHNKSKFSLARVRQEWNVNNIIRVLIYIAAVAVFL